VADRIVLTKADLAGPEASSEIEAALQRLNPSAGITLARDGCVDPEVLLADNAHLAEPAFPSRERGQHSSEVESFALRFDKPLDWAAVEQVLELLARLRGHDILRVKGLLDVKGCKGPVVVHQVQHLTAKPVELETWPDGARTSRLVFIVRRIRRSDIESLIEVALRLAEGAEVMPEDAIEVERDEPGS
jgi:G3E family GTPase